MDSTAARAPEAVAPRRAEAVRTAEDLATRVGADLGAPLGKEVRESALLLGLALVVVGLVAVLASTTALLG